MNDFKLSSRYIENGAARRSNGVDTIDHIVSQSHFESTNLGRVSDFFPNAVLQLFGAQDIQIPSSLPCRELPN